MNLGRPEELIEALNTGKAFTAVARVDYHLRRRKQMPTDSELQVAKEKQSRLRVLVDEWLDTGIQPDWSEDPSKRRLVDQSGNELLCKKAAEAYLAEHAPFVALRNEGLPPGQLMFGPFLQEVSDQWSVEVHATYLFSCMILSDWCASIAKCRYAKCGKYFLLSNPAKVWSQGTFCSSVHNRAHSAAKITQKRRDDSDKALLRRAAQLLRQRILKDVSWHEDEALKKSVAVELNRFIAKDKTSIRDEVDSKWLKWNRVKIEKLVKQQADRRSK